MRRGPTNCNREYAHRGEVAEREVEQDREQVVAEKRFHAGSCSEGLGWQ